MASPVPRSSFPRPNSNQNLPRLVTTEKVEVRHHPPFFVAFIFSPNTVATLFEKFLAELSRYVCTVFGQPREAIIFDTNIYISNKANKGTLGHYKINSWRIVAYGAISFIIIIPIIALIIYCVFRRAYKFSVTKTQVINQSRDNSSDESCDEPDSYTGKHRNQPGFRFFEGPKPTPSMPPPGPSRASLEQFRENRAQEGRIADLESFQKKWIDRLPQIEEIIKKKQPLIQLASRLPKITQLLEQQPSGSPFDKDQEARLMELATYLENIKNIFAERSKPDDESDNKSDDKSEQELAVSLLAILENCFIDKLLEDMHTLKDDQGTTSGEIETIRTELTKLKELIENLKYAADKSIEKFIEEQETKIEKLEGGLAAKRQEDDGKEKHIEQLKKKLIRANKNIAQLQAQLREPRGKKIFSSKPTGEHKEEADQRVGTHVTKLTETGTARNSTEGSEYGMISAPTPQGSLSGNGSGLLANLRTQSSDLQLVAEEQNLDPDDWRSRRNSNSSMGTEEKTDNNSFTHRRERRLHIHMGKEPRANSAPRATEEKSSKAAQKQRRRSLTPKRVRSLSPSSNRTSINSVDSRARSSFHNNTGIDSEKKTDKD